MPYPCNHFYFEINFHNREKKSMASSLLKFILLTAVLGTKKTDLLLSVTIS